MEALSLLQSALRNGPETLYIDLVDEQKRALSALPTESSCSVYRPRMSQRFAQLVKELAHLKPALYIHSGKFRLLEADFKVNCCPQPAGGEILVVHRRWGRLTRLNK